MCYPCGRILTSTFLYLPWKAIFRKLSTTLAVLEKGIDHIKSDKEMKTRVDWNLLRRQNDIRFVAPNYRSITDLKFEVDDRIGKIRDKRKTPAASEAVMQEYIEEVNALQHNAKAKYPIARKVLNDLFKAQHAKIPMMAAVRLKSVNHVKQLVTTIKPLVTFHVIAVLSKAEFETISEQFCNPDVVVVDRVEKLNDAVYLIVMVDRLRMGERVPATCLFWDVRCRYRKTGIGSLSTFIQDVGRCAGHQKPKAMVFVGIDHTNPKSIKTLDNLLKIRYGAVCIANQKPSRSGFGRSNLHSTQRLSFVLLVAEPQNRKDRCCPIND
jgi:hypothetical protein